MFPRVGLKENTRALIALWRVEIKTDQGKTSAIVGKAVKLTNLATLLFICPIILFVLNPVMLQNTALLWRNIWGDILDVKRLSITLTE
jgi:hypothetical protein